jgi:hypothetical protein
VAQIPVINALAANKLQGGFGTFASSLWALWRRSAAARG